MKPYQQTLIYHSLRFRRSITYYRVLQNPVICYGCVTFYCKNSLFGLDNNGPPPRMIGSRTVRTWSDSHRSRSRRARGNRDRRKQRVWSWRLAPQPQAHATSHSLLTAHLSALASLKLSAELPLSHRGLPCLIPTPITERIASPQHGGDIVAFPMPTCSIRAVLPRRLYGHFPHPPEPMGQPAA
jgi:hypothetical protein